VVVGRAVLSTLTATLVADGSSDYRALVPLITLLLDDITSLAFRINCAEGLGEGHSLERRLPRAVELFPCDLLLVHRDAEGQSANHREEEIKRDLASAGVSVPHVCIVPVRMTEAWLLADESAIRAAVGNVQGSAALSLPLPHLIESAAAKETLFRALEAASELGANRRRRFQPAQYRHRVAEAMTDLVGLRALPSFQRFENAVRQRLADLA
jgi:Domain of unknown function (DUF4276)